MSHPSLYIACGGSGCKTIQSLVELISHDLEMRDSFNDSIFIVLVDTDSKDLDETEKVITAAIPNVDGDHIVKIQISSNAVSLEDPVNDAFRGKSGKGLERLKGHWWFNDQSQLPFTAKKITPLSKGAGQCPPVSFFLTWSMMSEIEDKLRKVFDEMIEDRSGDVRDGKMADPFKDFSYHIISGLAGGTGRGCWELLSFKIRQICEHKFRAAPNPTAVLFDASVTLKNQEQPAQRISTKINSLTGLSQLQSWKRMSDAADRTERIPAGFLYRLPSLTIPEREEADVLVVGDDQNPKAPVDQVFLIFDRAGTAAVLDNSRDYYLMAGRALYARLRAATIGSAAINNSSFYQSFGASTFEVPASDIYYYYESGARVEFLRSLTTATPDIVQSCVSEFSETFRFDPGFKANDPRGLYLDRDEKEFTLWQQVVNEVQSMRAERLRGLQEDLEEAEDLEELKSQLAGYVQLDEPAVLEAVESVLKRQKSFAERAEPLLKKAYLRGASSDVKAVKRSIKNIVEFCNKIEKDVLGDQGCLARLPRALALDIEDPEALFDKLKSRAYGLVGDRFDPGEIGQISDAAKKAIVAKSENYNLLRRAYVDGVTRYLSDFVRINQNAVVIEKAANELLKGEQETMVKRLGVADYDECHQKVFTDPIRPADSEISVDSRRRFIQRRLKPVRSEEQFVKDCDDRAVINFRHPEKIDEICFDGMFGKSLDKKKKDVRDSLGNTISTAISVSPDFVEREFSLASTVAGLRGAWQSYLPGIVGDRDRFREETRDFAEFFGFVPEKDSNGEVEMPSLGDMVGKMVASLSASTAAYWQLDGKVDRSVNVFLPAFDGIDFDGGKSGEYESALTRVLPDGVEVKVHASSTKAKTNPFVMVAYHVATTDGGLDSVRSAQYWNETGVIDQLKMCERPGSANAIFHPLPGMHGTSFPDPTYISNKVLSESRWKPWISAEEQQQADIGAIQAIQALVYLFMDLPPGPLATEAAAVGWKMPLAELKTTGTVRFLRGGLEWRDGAVRPDNHPNCMIREHKEIGKVRAGISGVRRWLASPEGQGVLKSILAERDHFWRMLEDRGYKKGEAGTTSHYAALCDHLESVLSRLRDRADTSNPTEDVEVLTELYGAVSARRQDLI